jgi:magnesium transporter
MSDPTIPHAPDPTAPLDRVHTAAPPTTTVIAARGDEARTVPLGELATVLADHDTNVWIDLENTGEAGFAALEPTLRFHPMAVEDCVMDVNHPKVDDYRDYLYLAVHSARWEEADAEPKLHEIDILIGRRFLLTYHEDPTRSVTRARDLLDRRADVLGRGPDHLLYYILDVMVDNYMPILDLVHTRLDALEEQVLRAPRRRVLRDVLALKSGVAALRRIVGPQRDTILALTRDEFAAIRPEIRPYLRDIYDRMVRVSDMLDSFRDELATLLDIYVSQVSNQLNEVMKVLTAITVIIVPVTLIASIYGMNVRYPGFDTAWGFWLSMVIMAVTGVGMYLYFRSRRWL